LIPVWIIKSKMTASQIYIFVVFIALLLIGAAMFLFKKKKKRKKATFLITLSMIFVVVGIVLNNQTMGYIFIGIGVLFAIIDIIKKSKKN